MSLRAIADNGIVLHASALLGFDKEIIDIENGVKKSGTFNFICNECDGAFFQDYENPDNLEKDVEDGIIRIYNSCNDKQMKKSDLRKNAGISSSSLAKLGKDENVTTEVLVKVCNALKCDVGDIMEFVPDESSEEEN